MELQRLCSRRVFVAACVTVEGASESDRFLVFGSGTKLFVTGEQVRRPQLSVYPSARSRCRSGPRSRDLLLCVASAMTPPLVRFSWKRRRENGPLEELRPDQGERLELVVSGRVVAIRAVEPDAQYTYKYRCHVEHESGAADAPQDQEVSAAPPLPPVSPGSPGSAASSGEQDNWRRERQLCLTYVVLLAKSVVYCCGLCVLRASGKNERMNE
ncbi:uncharacterized protein LOC114844211 isoform X2 [Betta splendens]|nr:uncharacterized protein LOC114844211 isoform X2 [Betta splendens]XP_028987231.1 uncharacterized protein LOC114844211 isoform X2 [Betta splendens]